MDQSSKIRELLCPKEQWVNDKDVSKCKNCQRSFVPIFVWKHHCRFCGGVFCSDCVDNIISGQSIGYNVEKRLRHCNACKIRINMIRKESHQLLRKSSTSSYTETNFSMIEIEDPDLQINNFNQERKTQESIRNLLLQQRINLESLALSLLRQLSHQLCLKNNLEPATWELRLTQMAWKAAIQTKPQIFLRKTPFNLLEEIRVLTIVSPNEAVASACVKGLVILKNAPTKQLQTHMKFPRIITVKPSIEADSLMKNKQVRFDEIVLNQDKYLSGYMSSLFRLNPTIVFVEGNVSRGAMDLALQKNVMIIPKVKHQDLLKIQRLALIKRRIDNLLFIDKNRVSEIIGCCERVYFKNVRQGQTLLFVEHEAGMRTVLLGDTNEASNQNLKKVFTILLKAAWNLKNERELASRDIKLCPDHKNQSKSLVAKSFYLEKYLTVSSFLSSQTKSIFKMRYCQSKIENLSRPFQEYCKLRGRKCMLDPCGDICWRVSSMYEGLDINLGSFLMKCSAEAAVGCERCDGQHLYRFYLDNYVVTVSYEASGKLIKSLSAYGEQEQQQDIPTNQDNERQNSVLYYTLTKFIKNWKQQQSLHRSKLFFSMFFRCQDCNSVIGNPNLRSSIGNDLLLMSLSHFLYVIVNSYRNYQRSDKNLEILEQTNCQHELISRAFQCPRTLVKFTITKTQRSEILPIVFNEKMMKRVLSKDVSMVSDLFFKMIEKKRECIETIEREMEQLPFSGGATGMATSISIAGNSAVEHSYFLPYMKVGQSLTILKESIGEVQQNLGKYIEDGSKDWTVLMRKFSKMDHVIKASRQIIMFIVNALKKQKIEENTLQFPSSIEDHFDLEGFTLEEKLHTSPHLRKFSDHRPELSLIKYQSNPPSPFSTFSASRLRKQTSASSDTEFDDFLKRMRKERYLKYQGAYLYYPIGNIDDAVSLLACCLNSDEFKQGLNQYKDTITTKITFAKELITDWPPTPTILQIYKDLIKEDFYTGQGQEVQFWTYYHRQFQELRVSEKIDFKLYVRSLYGCQNWDSSGGKSNSSFSKAHNEVLVVKIINEKQFVEFQKFAPAYLKYMKSKRQNKQESYLAKIFGIYEVIIRSKVYKCVVMQNIFFGLDLIENVYDLKGSEVNRLAQPTSDKSFTRLDTNFLIDRDSIPYLLEPNVYDKTEYALTEDANFLKEQGVIDYSLLAIESGGNIRMGIIDFMRPYHFVQKIETLYKQIKSGKNPTVIPPQQYAERFVRAIRRYFAKSIRLQDQFDQ